MTEEVKLPLEWALRAATAVPAQLIGNAKAGCLITGTLMRSVIRIKNDLSSATFASE
jgi:hypothetical protein